MSSISSRVRRLEGRSQNDDSPFAILTDDELDRGMALLNGRIAAMTGRDPATVITEHDPSARLNRIDLEQFARRLKLELANV